MKFNTPLLLISLLALPFISCEPEEILESCSAEYSNRNTTMEFSSNRGVVTEVNGVYAICEVVSGTPNMCDGVTLYACNIPEQYKEEGLVVIFSGLKKTTLVDNSGGSQEKYLPDCPDCLGIIELTYIKGEHEHCTGFC